MIRRTPPGDAPSRHALRVAAGIVLMLGAGSVAGSPRGTTRRPVVAAIHVHSTFSNGRQSVAEIARRASEREVEVVVLTDSLLTEVTYGVWPLDRLGIPGLNRRHRPGILDHGVARYRKAIEGARQRFPDVLIVPGVEAAPAYYWKGSPRSGLTLHDFDRHLWIAGLGDAEVERLPVIGNETWSNTTLGWHRVWPPLIVLGAGAVALLMSTPGPVRRRRLSRSVATVLLVLGLALAWNNYPFGDVAQPRRGRHQPESFQRLIDFVKARGGVIYWSYPEASYPDVPVGRATMVSGPHPDDLLETDGYDGFEGLYGDDVTATEPGRQWDRALLAFLRGQRRTPPFVVTGIDYHGNAGAVDAWGDLDGGRTILLLEERSEDAVLAALRGGHAYATFMGLEEKFRLETFEVVSRDGEAGTHGDEVRGSAPVTVRIALRWEGAAPVGEPPFELRLILDGRVVNRWVERLPVEVEVAHPLPPGRHYFRLLGAAGRLNRVLSNPVFVEVERGGTLTETPAVGRSRSALRQVVVQRGAPRPRRPPGQRREPRRAQRRKRGTAQSPFGLGPGAHLHRVRQPHRLDDRPRQLEAAARAVVDRVNHAGRGHVEESEDPLGQIRRVRRRRHRTLHHLEPLPLPCLRRDGVDVVRPARSARSVEGRGPNDHSVGKRVEDPSLSLQLGLAVDL